MSIFGALFTAVSGLSSQAASMGMISNNIANVSTTGYKETDAAFESLVTTTDATSTYNSGSVRSLQNNRISQQGILQQTSNSTDIAISGNGLFVVKASATDPTAGPLYTRAGSFIENSTGNLVNSAGFYLQGWPLDQNGNLPAAQADVASLVPVNVAFLGGLTQPTSTTALALNLNSSQVQTPYPVAAGFAPDFTRAIQVYDSLGSPQNLTVNFKKMTSPTATVTGTTSLSAIAGPFSATPPFAATDTFQISVPGQVPAGPTTITLNGDVPKMLSDINSIVNVNGNPLVNAELNASGDLIIKAVNYGVANTITLTDGVGTPLALSTKLGMNAGIGVTNPPAPQPPSLLSPLAATPDPEGWWEVNFQSSTGAIIGSGAINFNGSGQLNATKSLTGQVPVPLSKIDWGNGSTLQNISFDMSGFTQFAGQYNVISSTQNGAALGLQTGVSIDSGGNVSAQFSNGQSSKIYRLPIATFADENGLNSQTGNVFAESNTSGSYNLREAGTGSAGSVAGSSLEASTVDIAQQFATMIVTQQAYSANSKVITAANQMTQALLQIIQ